MIPKRGTNKAALVTGASRGIGRAIAERLAAEGYRVFANDLRAREADLGDVVKAARAGGGLCEAIYRDVSDPSAVAAMAEDCIAKAGTVDVLVNNAGVLSVHPVWEIEPDEWDRMFDVNTKGTFLVTKAFLAHFRGRKVGRIINIASIGGKLGVRASRTIARRKPPSSTSPRFLRWKLQPTASPSTRLSEDHRYRNGAEQLP
jgi:NAD(P)-dependent dehydrogenase (short-subunit alcohol dehydrogenase family)